MKKDIVAGYIWPSSHQEGDSAYDSSYAKRYPTEVLECPDDEVILEPNKIFTLIIDYPLEYPAKFVVKTGPNGMTRREFANVATQSYKKVYKTPIKYGVWGHSIDDLTIHTLYVQDDVITLGVDS